MSNAQPTALQLEPVDQTTLQQVLAEPAGYFEATGQTLAELQQMIVQSRKLNCEGKPLGYADLVMAISENLRRMCEHPDPQHATAIAALALRIREEHLV